MLEGGGSCVAAIPIVCIAAFSAGVARIGLGSCKAAIAVDTHAADGLRIVASAKYASSFRFTAVAVY
jgi:hypothetical protein